MKPNKETKKERRDDRWNQRDANQLPPKPIVVPPPTPIPNPVIPPPVVVPPPVIPIATIPPAQTTPITVGAGLIPNVADLNLATVQAAVDAASNGDTLILPEGNVSWTGRLDVNNKNIGLLGQTTVTGTRDAGFIVHDGTIIRDNVARVDGNALLFECRNIDGAFTIGGLTIKGDTLLTTNQDGAGIRLHGGSDQFRMTQVHFDHIYSLQDCMTLGRAYGVADHCVFDSFDLAALMRNGGTYDNFGNESWTLDPNYGTNKFFFFEQCHFNNSDPTVQTHANIDCARGGRYVARYNLFTNAKANSHGTETYGRERSSRAIEVYENKFAWAMGYGPTGGQLRGGTMLHWNNVFTNFGSSMGLRVYRTFGTYIFGRADGVTPSWDVVADTDGTTPVATGTTGHLFYSGTHTGADNAPVLTDSNASFPGSNGLRPYVIRNMGASGSSFQWVSFFGTNGTNTSTTATIGQTTDDNNAAFLWDNGDHYEIRKVLIAIDQPGRGKGDLIDPTGPTIASGPNTGNVAWPRQALEPVMSWNNTNNGSSIGISSYGEPMLVENVDFYNRAPQSGDYCFPYTPYTYPHPLAT